MTRRWLALIAIPALLIGATVFDQRGNTERARRSGVAAPGSVAEQADLAQYGAVASPDDALASTWYCAGGTSSGSGIAEQVVVIANPTPRATTGTITAVPDTGKPVTKAVVVGAYGRIRVPVRSLVTAGWAAARVELRGAGMVVDHEVSGPLGRDAAPCTTTASDRWYFATGATSRNASETLVLYNPFADDASVDITAVTSDGQRVPSAYRGLLVPAHSVVATRVNDQVRSNGVQVATEVVSRSGRIVVDRIQTFDGRTAYSTAEETAKEPYRPRGLTVAAGVPRPASSWMFPLGLKAAGMHERFVVFNPSFTREADVDVGVTLVDPARNGEIDPLRVSVGPRSFQIVELDGEDRVTAGVDHGTVVRSRNGVPIVVDRQLAGQDPFPARGAATSSGTALVGTRWVFAAGGNAPKRTVERISVQNPSARRVRVQLRMFVDGRLRAVPGVGPVTLGSFAHSELRFSSALDASQLSVLVTADAPIAAERFLFVPDAEGMSTSVGVPAPSGLARVEPSAAGQ